MKKTVITLSVLIFSTSFCMAQNIRDVQDKQKQEQQAIEKQKQAAEEKKRQEVKAQKEREAQTLKEHLEEINRRYDNAIESAKKNFNLKNYAQAKQDYLTAIELKPENAPLFKDKIAEIDKLAAKKAIEDAKKENERLYEQAIFSAKKEFELKQYAQAKKNYQTALQLKPQNADFINLEIKKIDDAIAEQKKQDEEKEREKQYQTYIALAEKNVKSQQYVQAKYDYQSALKLKPENANYINQEIAKLDDLILIQQEQQRKQKEQFQKQQKQEQNKAKFKKVIKIVGIVAVVAAVVIYVAVHGEVESVE